MVDVAGPLPPGAGGDHLVAHPHRVHPRDRLAGAVRRVGRTYAPPSGG
ncbi:hypothetical protein [Streptomyces sp. NPDC057381]